MEKGKPSGPPTTRAERRQGSRFPGAVPVKVKWMSLSGTTTVAETQARDVSAQGGLLQLNPPPHVGSELEITNLFTQDVARARVIAVRQAPGGAPLGVAVVLVPPDETFWGVNFQLKRASAELMKLEKTLRVGGIDVRVLREFRDAVDYVRKTAWVVQEWQERLSKHRDAETVLSLLTVERIRRAAQLNRDLASDLDAHEVASGTPGIPELLDVVKQLQQSLNRWMTGG